MPEDALDHIGLVPALDDGDDFHLAAAVRTAKRVDFVDALVQRRPSRTAQLPVWGVLVVDGVSSVSPDAVLAAFLLIRADRMAAALLGDIENANGNSNRASIDSVGLHVIALSVLGLYLVLASLPAMLQSVSQLSAVMGQLGPQMLKTQLPRLAGQFLKRRR
jgi:hypothetical protein